MCHVQTQMSLNFFYTRQLENQDIYLEVMPLPNGFVLDVCHWILQQFPPILLQYGQKNKMPRPVQTLDEPMSLSKPSHCESKKNISLYIKNISIINKAKVH